MDLSGKRPPSWGGFHYLMMIADDSRLGWTLFVKQRFDVRRAHCFASFLDDIGTQGTPSIVEGQRHIVHQGVGVRDAVELLSRDEYL